jgi:DNA polymerase alpha subunit A
MERSRRTIKQRAPASKFEELRAARSGGKSRLEQYKPDEDDHALYDEIDEQDYQRAKLQDDFVVDDRGEGYVDNGMDELERDQRYSSDEDEAEESRRRGKKGKKGKKGDVEKVSEGAIDRLFRKPAIQMPKKAAVSTEEDADFMASILGEMDETVTSSARNLKRDRQPTHDSRPNKKRHSSPTPPLRTSSVGNRQPVRHHPVKPEVPSSPPLHALTLDSDDHNGGFGDHGFGDDDGGFSMEMDDDYTNAPMPSSPPAKPATNGVDLTAESDDDLPVVKKIATAKPSTTKSVNISASKPAPPPPVKVAVVKREPSPVAEIPDATWRDLDSTLNVTAAPSASSTKASPGEVLETMTITVKEMVEQEDGTDLEVEKQVEKSVVNVFWLDYGEFNGVLGIFGKVFNKKSQQWISCFVKVEGIERCLYFLPREQNKGISLPTSNKAQMRK